MTFGIVTSLAAQAEDSVHNYFEGMRIRGLWVIAEEYALKELKRDEVPVEERNVWAVELSQTLVEHGAAVPEQRSELWAESERVIRDALATSQTPELVAQISFLRATQAETLSWEAKLSPNQVDLQNKAGTQLRNAIEQLQLVLREKFTELRAYDLLTQRLRLELGKSVVLLAEQTQSNADQSHLWTVATNTLKPLTKEDSALSIYLSANLLRARIARQANDFEKANTTLDNLLNETAYPFRDRVLAEQMRIRLAQNKPDEAIAIIRIRWQSKPAPSDELLAVTVDGLLTSWKLADAKKNEDLKKELMNEARKVHEQTSGRWRQWTHMRLQQFDENSKLGQELADAIRLGRAAYHGGKLDEAVTLYSTAIGIAIKTGQVEHALEFAMTRASILLTQQRWSDASQAYREIVDRFPSHTQAAQADLLKCYASGRQSTASQSQPDREFYEAALKQHLQQFSSSPTVAEATWMLATHLEQRLQWTDALTQYRNIPKENAHFDEACLRITIVFENILNRLRELDGPVAEWEDNSVREINRLGNMFPMPPARWNLAQCQTGLRCAQLLLEHRDRHYAAADVWLTRIDQTINMERTLARSTEKPVAGSWEQLSQAVSQLRIVSLAGQQKLKEASQLLSNLGASDPLTMLGVLQGLSELGGNVDPERRRELGQLQEQAIAEINARKTTLTPEQQQLLSECTAEAFVALGDFPEAAAVYETLIKKQPKDKRLIHKVISVYKERGQPGDLEQAKTWWTKLERLEKAGSIPWINARLEIAKLMIQLGDAAAAKKLLGVTKTLYPQLGNAELASEIEQLLQ